MPLAYYFDLMSQPCRAVYMFLRMTGIPFQAKEIALRNLEHMTDDFARLNPMKKVPVIDDSGFVLTESVAILTYLCDKNKKHDWYPIDLQERARVNEYTHWQHLNLRINGSMVFRTKIMAPRITKKPVNERELEQWHGKWKESTSQLESIWLARSPYLAGARITIADLLGVCEMMQPISAGYDLDTARFPRVHDWMERVKKDSQPHFDEAHVFSMRMREKVLKDERSKL